MRRALGGHRETRRESCRLRPSPGTWTPMALGPARANGAGSPGGPRSQRQDCNWREHDQRPVTEILGIHDMTAKIISTYYSGGYSLNSKYSKLTITASGGIGGAGLYAGSFARIFNDGVVHGAGASNGIFLNAGGFVQNGDSVVTDALIEGGDGIVVNGAAGTVVNYGTIDGLGGGTGNVAAYAGVYLSNGVSVVNGAAGEVTALIEGANGVVVQGALGRITNFGTIQSTGIDGRAVYLLGGGPATNGSASDATALIVGDRFGVLSGGASVKIANFGTIQSTFSLG